MHEIKHEIPAFNMTPLILHNIQERLAGVLVAKLLITTRFHSAAVGNPIICFDTLLAPGIM